LRKKNTLKGETDFVTYGPMMVASSSFHSMHDSLKATVRN